MKFLFIYGLMLIFQYTNAQPIPHSLLALNKAQLARVDSFANAYLGANHVEIESNGYSPKRLKTDMKLIEFADQFLTSINTLQQLEKIMKLKKIKTIKTISDKDSCAYTKYQSITNGNLTIILFLKTYNNNDSIILRALKILTSTVPFYGKQKELLPCSFDHIYFRNHLLPVTRFRFFAYCDDLYSPSYIPELLEHPFLKTI